MKRVIFILSVCLCASITLGFVDLMYHLGVPDEYWMSEMDVNSCFIKANTTLVDVIVHLPKSLQLNETIPSEINNRALKASCYYACWLQTKELVTFSDVKNTLLDVTF